MKILYRYTLLLFLFIFSACSTQKNNFVTRTYHNITSHYNTYFNGKESFKEGVLKVEATVKDDFTKVLPVFLYSDPSAATAATSSMETAILKASKVIKMHSITAKPKKKRSATMTKKKKAFYEKPEYCNWIDDSYMLLGKAYFYKHDFFAAAETFEFVITTFQKEPIKYEAMIWLARVYNETKDFKKAQLILEQLEGDNKFPHRLDELFASTYADFFLKQQKYSEAISKLIIAVRKTSKKKNHIRYKYILAQLYHKSLDYRKASKYYKEVIEMNPPYEFAFNAKINRAECFDVDGEKGKEIKKQLNKMLKDEKNIDYKDQIYYALGNIAQKENSIDNAIYYYKLSVKSSISNNNQKSLSYLALGKIYFQEPDYTNAQMYYDSCALLLNNEYPDYKEIHQTSKKLNELVKYLNIVTLEDSLQKIAKMNESQRMKFILELIEKVKLQEELARKQKEEEMTSKAFYLMNRQNLTNTKTDASKKWYFYNPTTTSFGMTEFKKKWGTRVLEDNWRRKNKSVVSVEEISEENIETTDSASQKITYSNKSPQYYLKDLPLTDSLIKKSNARIIEALYNIGRIYKEGFEDYERSIKAYEELNNRFPDNEYQLVSFYALYRLNLLISNKQRADYYKEMIVTKYPNSKYAKMLSNPNYLAELEAEKNKMLQFYSETYSHFLNQNYPLVISNCNYADSVYDNADLAPKFTFLKAISLGKTGNFKALQSTLNSIIESYPKTEISKRSAAILTLLETGKYVELTNQLAAANTNPTVQTSNISSQIKKEMLSELYKFDSTTTHCYILILNTNNKNINQIRFNIISFNLENYSTYNLKVNDVALDSKNQALTVKNFDNLNAAKNYFEKIKNNTALFSDLKPDEYTQFIISTDNLTNFVNDKNIEKYKAFFEVYYLKR